MKLRDLVTVIGLCACQHADESAPTTAATTNAPASPTASAAPVASASAAPSATAEGNMWGEPIGDSFGGREGAAGTADAGASATIGAGNVGPGHGFGTGQGRPTHPNARIRMGAPTVTGRLPPEVIQRIVRQNSGRLRLCYESALRADPKAAGVIATKFVIDAQGNVASSAREASTTFADASAVACVVDTFKSLSFPEPENGTVTVIYPATFEPGDSP